MKAANTPYYHEIVKPKGRTPFYAEYVPENSYEARFPIFSCKPLFHLEL